MFTESISLGADWEIHYCTMPYPHVYFISAKKKNIKSEQQLTITQEPTEKIPTIKTPGKNRSAIAVFPQVGTPPCIDQYGFIEEQGAFEGYVISQKFAKGVFSSKALKFAERWRGHYVFYEEFKIIVEYELILKGDAFHGFAQSAGPEELLALGRADIPAYFGCLPPPCEADFGVVKAYRTICNGIYWVWIGTTLRVFHQKYSTQYSPCEETVELCLAVNKYVSDPLLSEKAEEIASGYKDYRFFRENEIAIALFELYHKKEISALISSHDNLLSTLWKAFPDYVDWQNEACPGNPIPKAIKRFRDFLDKRPVYPGPASF